MNRRNLQYIKKLNPKKQIRLVDNKHKTKQFLSQRGIPVGETFALIKNRNQLFSFDFAKLPESFVVKPNGGSMGNGIFIVKRLSDVVDAVEKNFLLAFNQKISHRLFGRKIFPYIFKTSGKKLTDFSFKKKLAKIVDGNYSSGDRSTDILVEEKLIPGNGFELFCEYGLADIRVIVCNLVPVAAMVRVPTLASDGKANLAQGGIGLGIDIATGKITTLAVDVKSLNPKFYDKEFPEKYKQFYHARIPFWSDILLHSANVQYFINMGFVGIDWVITDAGPQLLEVNGKAGLAIQNISMVPLQKVLDKIGDLSITTPQKGVEVAKSLFSPQKQSLIASGKLVYLSQKGLLSGKKDDEKLEHDVIVEVNIKKKRNYISGRLANKIKNMKKISLKLSGTDTIFKNPTFYTSDSLSGNRIQLGIAQLEKYYIKPVHKLHPSIKFINSNHLLGDEVDSLQLLDQKIYEIGKEINISKYLKPVNYLDEFDKFVSKNAKYNPIFIYNFPTKEQIISWETRLKKLWDEHNKGELLHSHFAQLFYEKIKELQIKTKMLKAYRKQDFDLILKSNEEMYGGLDDEMNVFVKEKLETFKPYGEDVFGKKLSRIQVYKQVEKILNHYKCKNVKIRTDSQMLARISVSISNNGAINLSPNALFREHEFLSTLEHEIGVHVRRFLAGKKTGWWLMSRGTAFYQRDEEGLAVYLATEKYKEFYSEYENQKIYQNYRLALQAQTHNFQQLADIIIQRNFLRSRSSGYATVFNQVLRLKKGIKKTKIIHQGAIQWKGKIYLEGYKKIHDWVASGGDVNEMMIGKVKIEDLNVIT